MHTLHVLKENEVKGYLYFIATPSCPDLCKIGFTRGSTSERLRQLDTTGVPQEFVLIASFHVNHVEDCERSVHNSLSEFRVRSNREFFRLTAAEAVVKSFDKIKNFLVGIEDVQSEDLDLDSIDDSILQLIFHSKHGQIWPQKVTWELGINRQESHFRLGELAERGFLEENAEMYSLTHKGRKYIFSAGLVIDEILSGGDFH